MGCFSLIKVSDRFQGLVDGSLTTISGMTLEAWRLTPIIQSKPLAPVGRAVHPPPQWGTEGTNIMASDPPIDTGTETATATRIKLEPPEALQPIAVKEASGLVPLKNEETSELDQ